jgi:hypothetical protein
MTAASLRRMDFAALLRAASCFLKMKMSAGSAPNHFAYWPQRAQLRLGENRDSNRKTATALFGPKTYRVSSEAGNKGRFASSTARRIAHDAGLFKDELRPVSIGPRAFSDFLKFARGRARSTDATPVPGSAKGFREVCNMPGCRVNRKIRNRKKSSRRANVKYRHVVARPFGKQMAGELSERDNVHKRHCSLRTGSLVEKAPLSFVRRY